MSMSKWLLHTECHFINTTNNYIQTLRTKTSDVKQDKWLLNKQDKNFDLQMASDFHTKLNFCNSE